MRLKAPWKSIHGRANRAIQAKVRLLHLSERTENAMVSAFAPHDRNERSSLPSFFFEVVSAAASGSLPVVRSLMRGRDMFESIPNSMAGTDTSNNMLCHLRTNFSDSATTEKNREMFTR